jgi:hypothetical protein
MQNNKRIGRLTFKPAHLHFCAAFGDRK